MRKTPAGLVVLSVLLTLVSGTAAVADDAPQPSIFIPQVNWDLGTVVEQDHYEHTFSVENHGTADLAIDKVQPGCGCTAAEFDKVIPAGKTGVIKLVIDGSKVHGSFKKYATIHSNDPEHPTVSISLAGSETQYITASPSDKVFLEGHYGEPVEKTVVVTSNEEGTDFEVIGASSSIDDDITYRFEPGPDKNQYTVKIFKNPKLPNVSAYGALTLETNVERAPEKVIQVQVVTKGTISVEPSMVNYGVVPFGTDGKEAPVIERNVTVLRSEGEFDIRDVSFNSERYEATVEAVTPGKRYTVGVHYHPPVKREPRQRDVGEMTIHTSDPREPTVIVRLVARAE
jgi:hypothetical protein